MAAPNLKSPESVTGKTRGYLVTDVVAPAISNLAESGKVFKINSLYCANINGASSASISIYIRKGATDHPLAFGISIPPNTTQVLISREAYIYLEENDSIRAISSTPSSLSLIISYEDIM
jgi:hypothetical protein